LDTKNLVFRNIILNYSIDSSLCSEWLIKKLYLIIKFIIMWLIHLEWIEQFKKEVLEFNGIVLIDFWAERCGPCRMLWPILEELVIDNEGKPIKIIKVNVESHENWPLAQSFQVSSIPAVFVLKNWQVIKPIIGVNPKHVYQWEIDFLLSEGTDDEIEMAN
jgi:thioredoxin 1